MPILLLALFMFLPSTAFAKEELQPEELPGPVQEQISGCSCGFTLTPSKGPHAPFVIGWPLGEKSAYLQLNGKTHQLEVEEIYPRGKAGKEASVGDKVIFKLAGTTVAATLTCAVSTTCWGQAECESIGYTGKLVIKSAGKKGIFPVQGWCGC